MKNDCYSCYLLQNIAQTCPFPEMVSFYLSTLNGRERDPLPPEFLPGIWAFWIAWFYFGSGTDAVKILSSSVLSMFWHVLGNTLVVWVCLCDSFERGEDGADHRCSMHKCVLSGLFLACLFPNVVPSHSAFHFLAFPPSPQSPLLMYLCTLRRIKHHPNSFLDLIVDLESSGKISLGTYSVIVFTWGCHRWKPMLCY